MEKNMAINAPKNTNQSSKRHISLPDIHSMVANSKIAAILNPEGEIQTIPVEQAAQIFHKKSILVCHAPLTKARLGLDIVKTYDVLELFAFTHPVTFCVPTPQGLAKALHLNVPETLEDMPAALFEIATALLTDLQNDPWMETANPLKIAEVMGLKGKGWVWTPYIFSALGQTYDPNNEILSRSALNIWKHLPEWAEEAPSGPTSHFGVNATESKERLSELLSRGDRRTEARPQQKEYATLIAKAFSPPQTEDNPHIIVAEAGTGVGKTLGYLAPASVWAEKNDSTVWISTYTKNLQRQIDLELDRLYPHPDVKNAFVTVRKGRENYLCLLNLEDTAAGTPLARHPHHAIAAGIMARWAMATKDGDLSGPEFPGWLTTILDPRYTLGLSDKRGECLFSACDHYHRCFVERSVRKSKHARIVVANHALIMIQTALSSSSEELPGRYIFDEGHHLFESADSAFSAHLTGREMADLRRWILGAEEQSLSRARGIKRRIEDIISGNDEEEKLLQAILHAARNLVATGWNKRLKEKTYGNVAEEFLIQVKQQVFARSSGNDGPYALETPIHPAIPELILSAVNLKNALINLALPMKILAEKLRKKLEDNAQHMDSDTRKRIDAISQSLERRGQMTLGGWISLLETIEKDTPEQGFVDWLEIERYEGQFLDLGAYRHHIDPMKIFATSLKPHVHGVAITSATLRDSSQDEKDGATWSSALQRCAASYLSNEIETQSFESPFDYAEQTRIFIIDDVRKEDIQQVGFAYRYLFEASNGGGLGLFTAIHRLRCVHGIIAEKLEAKGIPLYAQHVDKIDTGTLVDMFRDDAKACLLGTDAVRDGVDVPGDSLRLIVFDRVPWPRPTILHKARRAAFGQRQYEEMITRLKLKQAFGRLIRRETDRGVFVMLDSRLPSRLQDAFPKTVTIEKIGLAQAADNIRLFLKQGK